MGKGLVVIGVHSPEFFWERNLDNVRDAVKRFGLLYAITIDNGFAIWDSYNTRYWPTLHLIDKRGVVRYSHIGEGAYDLTEQTIVRLLAE
jgi:hypothetical protein